LATIQTRPLEEDRRTHALGVAELALASALVRVPKAEVDQAAKRYRAKRRKKKK
jgi:hypothetical protein